MKQKIYKDMALISIMGFIYYGLENLYDGKSSPWMILVGGVCCFLIGRLNERQIFYERKMWQQCLTGTLITLFIEFLSGMVLNVWLSLNIWDYSELRFNVSGQICPQFAILWFMLIPFCIYVDDWLRYKIFQEEKPIGILNNYKNLFIGN